MAFNLFKGGLVCPRTAGTLPASLSWKAAVSAPKSRVCVLLPCSSSWFTTFGWARFPAVGMSSCSSPPSCFRSHSCGRSTRVSPLNLLNYWTHVFTRLLPAASVVILLNLATGWNPQGRNAQS